jgi:hypothetical protein
MLIVAGDGRGLPFDYDELERWTRVGYERGMQSRKASGEIACEGKEAPGVVRSLRPVSLAGIRGIVLAQLLQSPTRGNSRPGFHAVISQATSRPTMQISQNNS